MNTIKKEMLKLGIVNGAISLITENGKYIPARNLIIKNEEDGITELSLTLFLGISFDFDEADKYITEK